MQKLLYIAPHLSTGGLPQYLVKKIELIKDDYEIYLVEYSDHTGGRLVVQKNKILALVDPDKFFALGEDKTELLSIIENIQPDIIHLEEIPEYFLNKEVALKIYREDRPYFIVETSHDSSMNTDNKQFFPDKFMFVSQWQIDQYKDINIPKILVEYPIEYVDRPDRTKALEKLGLDPNKKHILHIGLFTPRKNQAEFFDYARMLPEYEFHCVGNQADNFKFYWEPLMADKPDNVTWWNERTDVDSFYQSMDLFLFTSRGTQNNKETMPLVIREAISYKIPLLIYNLEVYQNYFDKFDSVNYLKFDDLENNKNLIQKSLGPLTKKTLLKLDEEAYVVSTYPVDSAIVKSTLQCLNSLKKDKRKIIVTSHAPVSKEIQELADYVIYDSNNILVEHSHFATSWVENEKYKSTIHLKGEKNNLYHGPTVYTNYYNAAALAKDLGIKKLFYINYDYSLTNIKYINSVSEKLNNYSGYFCSSEEPDGNHYTTYFCALRPETLLTNLPKISSPKDYQNLVKNLNAQSNSLEHIYYCAFKNETFFTVSKKEFSKITEDNFDFLNHAVIEHFTILPTNKSNYFCPWVRLASEKTFKNIKYTVNKNGKQIINRDLMANQRFEFWDMIPFISSDKFTISFDIFDSVTKEFLYNKKFELDSNYYNNIMPNNGLFEWKDPNEYIHSPKIKLMHLVTEPDTNKKEIRSIESVKEFCQLTGIKYEQRINKIWTDLPPKDTCNRPNDIQDKPGYYKLAPGHYGCYKAHTDALLAEDNKDYDYILIFEGDVIIDSPFSELRQSLDRFSRLAKENDQDIIGFGNPWKNRNLNGPKVEDIYTDVTPFIPAQSYLVNNDKLSHIQDKINTTPWDAFDMWVCNVARLRVGTAEKIYTKHLPGFSIIEQEFKGMDENSPEIYATK